MIQYFLTFNHGVHETKKNALKNPKWTMEELGKTKQRVEAKGDTKKTNRMI